MFFKMTKQTEIEKPNIEGFVSDKEIVADVMGVPEESFEKLHIEKHFQNKISLTYTQLKNLNDSIEQIWNSIFQSPKYKIKMYEDSLNISATNTGYLIPAITFELYENDKATGDKITTCEKNVVYNGNGKAYISKPNKYFLPRLLRLVLRKNYNMNDSARINYNNKLAQGAQEALRKFLEPERTDRTLDRILEEIRIEKPERLICASESEDFLASITGFMAEAVAKTESFAGMGATNEYKAPDSKNAGVIELVHEDPLLAGALKLYPNLMQLKETDKGKIAINAIIEFHNGSEQRLKEIYALLQNFSDEHKQIINSTVKTILNTKYNGRFNAILNQSRVNCL